MSDYYQTCIEAIKKHILEKEYDQARTLIEQELSMPYVPLEFENQLHAYARQLPQTAARIPLYFDDFDDLLTALNDGGERQDKALTSLARQNIRPHLDAIKTLLVSDHSKEVKQALLYIMMEQSIYDEVDVSLDDIEYRLIPANLESPLEADGVLEAKQWIEEHYAHNDPSFVLLCSQMIDHVVIELFPQVYEQGEGEMLAMEIMETVFKSLGREVEWQTFYEQQYRVENKKLQN